MATFTVLGLILGDQLLLAAVVPGRATVNVADPHDADADRGSRSSKHRLPATPRSWHGISTLTTSPSTPSPPAGWHSIPLSSTAAGLRER